MLISIEGSIGSGKSTTAKRLAERLGWSVVLEETTKHPFLADFYTDPARYAIETELGFVLLHYHQIKVLLPGDAVADFAAAKDLVFARMNLVGQDLELFEHVYAKLRVAAMKPELAVYIDVPLQTLQGRISTRGRPYELGITTEYLTRLRSYYMSNLTDLAKRVEILTLTGTESREAVAGLVHDLVRQAIFGEERLL